ncbi:MAG: cell surface protein SprA [Bacteroidetes bacterium]|nr:cell surface protein SprA [Bacteroidota bacterium]
MIRVIKYLFTFILFVSFFVIVWETSAGGYGDGTIVVPWLPPDTIPEEDSIPPVSLIYNFQDNGELLFVPADTHGLFLGNPSNLQTEIEYDPETNQYLFQNKIGDLNYRNPTYMSFDEYQEFELKNSVRSYWKERSMGSAGLDRGDGIIPKIYIGGKFFETIFGNNTIDIRPQGSAELIFGIMNNKTDNPTLNVRQRRTTNFDFDMKIQMNVVAKIGDKIEFRTNYNTEATFDFENKLQLKYEGKEDEIIKLIEAGNVSLPLNTSLITGNQSLFGIKTKLQFGRTMVTAVYSEQQSEISSVTVQGGAQSNDFYLTALDYDENKHFFLSHYFRDHYESVLSELPLVISDINITRIEVWVTNIGAAVTENRNIVAFQDLGENKVIYNAAVLPNPGRVYPSNNSNTLLENLDTNNIRDINTASNYLKSLGYNPGIDFEKVEVARKLDRSEYTLNSRLGFISLNTTLNSDQTLAVSYQFTVIGQDSSVFQVGEFSDQGIVSPSCLLVKLLKSPTLDISVPMWNLMMKNIYSIGAYQVSREKFIMNILYSGNDNGVPTGYFEEGPDNIKGVPLLHVFNLDNLNQQMNPPDDGLFDFLDGAATNGGTIQASNGKIFFTVLEPFGSYLRNEIISNGGDSALANRYCYDSLYTLTKTGAEQFPDKNRYILEGFYQSSSGSEISLNAFNVPRGSVKVTAGGRTLTENVDYTVDYTLGRVRIINEGILNSGTPIHVSMENNTLFNIQTKRLMGSRIEHTINPNFLIGGTILNLRERPLTQKVSYGNDPINNTIWGLDLNYQAESRFLTKMVDKIPLIETKAPSMVSITAEFAHFLPGHSKAIGKTGTSYIDDFEGAKSTIDLKNYGTWFNASTPQGQPDLFPETYIAGAFNFKTQIDYGMNRAKLAWYIIDPLFYDRNSTLVPSNVTKDELSKDVVRQVLETEVFPNKDIPSGTPTNIAVFNLAYYPSERGPYNFDVVPGPYTSGINTDGSLADPETRWGGIMRKIESTDFEATNVEYIEFWLMDPFSEDSTNKGKLYFNLGDVSEDVLRDSRKSYENGLPTTSEVKNVDTTGWGRVPNVQALVESFDNEEGSRPYQDVGYDGLGDNDERSFYSSAGMHPYLDTIAAIFGPNSEAYQDAFLDPSADNYHYFRGSDFDGNPFYSSVLERYKNFNGPDGNSPTDAQNQENYPTAATTLPDIEDLNRDNTLSESERYFQYEIELDPQKMEVGNQYITDVFTAQGIQLPNNKVTSTKWYQFKIPVSQPDRAIGGIKDFRSIRFMRIFMKDFERPVVLRFATFELVRGEWRKYQHDLLAAGEYIPDDIQALTTFDISTLNIEENGFRQPVPYVIPPGIEREINLGTTNLIRLNEQAMVLNVCGLVDGDARAAFKTTDFDFRQYKNLKMFVHAEKSIESQELEYGDLSCFIRIGTDFTENYYEFEVPLTFTPWGTPATDPDAIWPIANNFEIDLIHLVSVKHRRNIAMREPGSEVQLTFPYVEYSGDRKITVLGSPTISDVKTIMIGVRNPKKPGVVEMEPVCAEVWVNELRLTDFNKKGGWAATTTLQAQLADFGQLTVSGMHSSAGFASLDSKISDVNLESISQFDVSTDLELGKFFPEKAGIRIPMHFDYSETHITPEYNPLDPDILLQDDLNSYVAKDKQDSVKRLVVDYTQRKNINFMNIRKDRVGSSKKPRVYDIENFNFTYAYSEVYARNVDIEYDLLQEYRGGFGYNFALSPKNVRPLEKIGFISKTKALTIIKDFNFYFLPKSFSFTTEMNKAYGEMKLRDKSVGDIKIRPTYNKSWNWDRKYDLKFDLAKSLTLQFNALANTFINEAPGSKNKNSEWYDDKARDSIDVRSQIFNFGIMDRYVQNFTLNYAIPIDKLPFLEWVTANFTYQSGYSWTASPLSIQDRFGNQIENSRTVQLNGNLAFDKLYNKSKYLKQLLRPKNQRQRGGPAPRRGGRQDDQQAQDGAEADSTDKPGVNYFKVIGEGVLKILLSVKKANFTYSQSSGTTLPGFIPQPNILGSRWSDGAPGLGFTFGSQKDIRQEAADKGWITQDSTLNQPYLKKYQDAFVFRTNLEPFPDFKIEITADRNYSENHQEYFRYSDSLASFQAFSPMDAGSFSISHITWATAFENDSKDNISATFEKMKNMRPEIAEQLARENPNWNGQYIYDSITGDYYPEGYGPTSPEVLRPAFLAAYSGKSANKADMRYFPSIPLPNWRVTYSGLSKIEFISSFLKKLTLSHSYRSTYSINSFRSNINYVDANGYPIQTQQYSTDYIPRYDMGQITITEQFAPLIGIDMTWHNSLSTKIEYKKSRNLNLSFANNQVTEVKSNEFVVGLGYRIKSLGFSVRAMGGGGRKTRMESDVNIKLDFSIRSNKTILRRIDEEINQVSAGQKIISINASIDYMLNQNLNIRFFFDKIINNPFVSNQYKNSTTNGGISLRFSLSQ